MPRIKRRQLLARRDYDSRHVFAVRCGCDFFRIGMSEAAMREAWPVLREQAFELHRDRRRGASAQEPTKEYLARTEASHREYGYPTSIMPGGWWRFESPEPRDERIHEAEQLNRMRVRLADEEADLVVEALRQLKTARAALAARKKG